MAVNEVKNAVVRTAKAVLFQHRVRIRGKVAVGKKEELCISDELLAMTGVKGILTCTIGACAGPVRTRIAATRYAVGRYVSHVDIIGPD